MKALNKPELLAPCFPMFNLKPSSVTVDCDMAQFTLKYGVVEIECEAQATEYSDSIYLEPQFDPENGKDVPYTRLELDIDTPVTPLCYDIELVEGQKIKLTDAQVLVINGWLKDICESEFETQLGMVA